MTTRRGLRYDSSRSRLAVFNNIAPSLSLTSPLEVGSGGTGVSSLDDHYVLIGSGTGAITPVSPGTSGYILTSNGTGADPTFQATTEKGLSVGMAMVVGR